MAISTHFAVFYTSTRVIMRNFALVKLCTIFYPNTMKKQLYCAFLFCIAALSAMPLSAQTSDGQSTEGKDFWVTFLQADQHTSKNGDFDGSYNTLKLSLSISSRSNGEVTIANPYTDYVETVPVTAGELKIIEVYSGHPRTNDARSAMTTTGKICYAVNSEEVDTCALHITSTVDISLFATNYKKATFDATNVLPTSSLLDSYIIQTYTPSDHQGTNLTQGSHFAVIAAEDNTIVDYCPSVNTEAINNAKNKQKNKYPLSDEDNALLNYQYGRDTLHSPVLKKGQVFYVWTGKKDGEDGDLSGTYVKARGNKKIAVFQGCPHTNIPYQKKERDHIFSQAMPTQYWGNSFVLTSSASRKRDKIRVLALNDGTEVRIDGKLVHTFDFSIDKKHYFEFDLGEEYGSLSSPLVTGKSCVLETSCPCAVHLFMVSWQYDSEQKCGDPAMLWINPIEQQIDRVTFATYASTNGTTNHYTNIVTDKPELMLLDGSSIESDFTPVGSTINGVQYYFAQKSLGTAAATHTLKSDGSNFIAHVYGFTANESYGYSAGGATKPLTQAITINGQVFTPDSHNLLCGEDTIHFGCNLNYEFEKIVWGFGDGQTATSMGPDSVAKMDHYYKESGVYEAYALIYRQSSNLCVGQNAVDSIPITVNIGRFTFSISDMDIPCKVEGQPFVGKIFFDNQSGVDLQGENTTIEYTDAALAAGFKNSELTTNETDNYFGIVIPDGAKAGEEYGIHLKIESDCGGTDTTLLFMLNYDNDVLTQRFTTVLGLKKDASFEGKTLTDFQWYRTSDSTAVAGQVSGVLHLEDVDATDSYYLCFYINKGTNSEVQTCTCAKAFNPNPQDYNKFGEGVEIIATTAPAGERIFVNAKEAATAQWINVNGDILGEVSLPAGGCTITVPAEAGFYILRVSTEKQVRNFKFLVTK